MSEKEQRMKMLVEELDKITKEFQALCDENEIDVEDEAIEALKTAAMKLAYVKKYYDVMKDEIIFFPSISKLIMNAELMEEAETHYFDEGDEFPIQYTKMLKNAVMVVNPLQEGSEEQGHDSDEYMAKLGMDVEL
jgi:hypothetical protein